MNTNFVKTIVPIDLYKAVEELGELVICHFEPNEVSLSSGNDETTTMIDCYESSCPKAEYDADAMQAAFDAYKVKMEAARLGIAKSQKTAEITAYDTSDSVNSFSLNGASVWLDKDTRVGLMNSTTISKNMGKETTTLWLGSVKLEVNCDMAIQLLSALEMYALECFNVTAAHKKAVSELTTIEEVEAYDITADYPSKLEMNI